MTAPGGNPGGHGGTGTGRPSARTEAERLIATILALREVGGLPGADGIIGAAVLAQRLLRQGGSQVATGSPECCVCPVCRLISAVRDPGPDVVEKIVTGAGDLASGLASVLRTLGGVARPGPEQPAEARRPASTADEVWHAATSAGSERPGEPAAGTAGGPAAAGEETSGDPWHAATREHGAGAVGAPPAEPARKVARKVVKTPVRKAPAEPAKAAGKAPVRKAPAEPAKAAGKTPVRRAPAPEAGDSGERAENAPRDAGL